MNRRTVAAGVGLSAVSLVGGQAIATPAWQPVHVVATAGHGGVFGPLVVANARGDAAAAWVDRSSKRLRVAQRPAQHQWRSAVNVSAAHLSADDQQAAIDARNDMVVAWDAFDGQHELLQAAFHRAGHAWNRPITLARLAQGNPARPQVAMNAEGAVTIVWGAGTGSARRLQVVRRTAAGHWSGKVRLPGTGQSTLDPGVAMDGLGNAVVVWQRVLDATTSTIQVTRRKVGHSWTRPHTVSTAAYNSQGAQIASNPRGDAVVVWRSCNPDASLCGVQAARRPKGGSWLAPTTLTRVGQHTADLQLALGAHGDAMVTWDRVVDGTAQGVQVSRRAAKGRWYGPVTVSDLGWSSSVALDARGDAVVTYQISGDPTQIDAIRRAHGGSWSAPVRLSKARAVGAAVASDARGDAIAVWQQSSNNQTQIAARVRSTR